MAMLLNRLRNINKKSAPPSDADKSPETSTTQRKKEETRAKKKAPDAPELSKFLDAKDYLGAVAFIKHKQNNEKYESTMELWLGHCFYRAGEFDKAKQVYEGMLSRGEFVEDVYVYLACCLYHLGYVDDARAAAAKGGKSPLQNRLRMQIAMRQRNEADLRLTHGNLKNTVEDSLCLASVHFLRGHYVESREVLENLQKENPMFTALKFYLAMVYMKIDFPGDARDMVRAYLSEYPDSLAAQNLLNCCNFRLGSPVHLDQNAFESYYPAMKMIYKHNQVVFNRGTNAMLVLPTLVNHVPEALLNLCVYHLNRDEMDAAYKLAQEIDTESVHDIMAKAIVYSIVGQSMLSGDLMSEARTLFKQIAENPHEKDTIQGRQCGAAYYFLTGDYESVVIYLMSIKGECYHDENFYFNLGQALVKTERYEEAISHLAEITSINNPLLTQNLVRSYVMSRQPEHAWDLFMKVRNPNEHPQLLRIIAHDSFKTHQFLCTARAYDALEKIDPSPDHWVGKRAAVAGQFQKLVKGQCTGKEMAEVLEYLENGTHSQIESIANTIRKYAREHGVSLTD